jgi:phytoene desaturase
MHALPRALAAAAQKHGVEIHYNTTVSTIEHHNGRATAAITESGERYTFDAVVVNPDLPVAYRELLGKTPRKVAKLNYSPSCVTLLVGSNKGYDHLAHDNIHFGKSWMASSMSSSIRKNS